MLRTVRPAFRLCKVPGPAFRTVRFLATKLNSEPTEVFTKVSDTNDPQRSRFFQYLWGMWMKNDAQERAKRETRFLIEGVATLLQDLNATRKDSKMVDKSGEPFVRKPVSLKDGTVVLTNNLALDIIGEAADAVAIQSIASIHEGKHHRVYKVLLSTGKELVLRIPYKLESDAAVEAKIKSEVATLDFLNLKIGALVPRVVAYGSTRANALQTPFILMEYVSGDSLMKLWEPLADEKAAPGAVEALNSVISPIADFQDKALSVVFNRSGSLYFFDDVSVQNQGVPAYDGEENPLLKNRWRVGPSVEKPFSNKGLLSASELSEVNGPWDAEKPEKVILAVGQVELASLKARLAVAQADAGSVENQDLLRKQISTFENYVSLSDKLLNPKSPAIMNAADLFKPRLSFADLDPLNVILSGDKHHFLDFEYTTIKPFVLSLYPQFVAYHGAKVYDLEEDIPDYASMDEVEQQQYQFMYFKTRNERLWEVALNERRHDLIAVASPHIKVLKAPYVQALDFKQDKDYLYVEGAIVQLQAMWEAYVANGLTNTTETAFPVAYTAEYLDEHQKFLEEYQLETVSTPFAATGGWVPQDMFEKLKEQGIIVEEKNGDYRVETEAALADAPEGAN